MPLQYTKAPTVSVGSAITSGQYNKLADAFNDRLQGGVADPTWRLFWYSHALLRGMRNPDASRTNYPAEDETWKFYNHIAHDAGLDWPVAPAGTPEGINVVNPLGAFVFGQEPSLYDEPGRMNWDASEQTGIDLDPAPSTPLDFWELGKNQRGVTDSTGSDLTLAYALVAAQSHGRIPVGSNSFYLKGYGGFFSSASLDATTPLCNDNYNLDIRPSFRNIDEAKDCNYLTCPEDSQSGDADCPGLAKPLRGWSQGFTSYLLYHWDGTITHLPFDNFFEGPYTDNAILRRQHSEQLQQTLNKFVSEFRGTTAQRQASDYEIFGTGFDFQKFLTTQYYLAPAYGEPTGYDGALEAIYPQFDWPAGSPAGTFGTYNASTTYAIHSGFVLAGAIAVGDPITADKRFEIYLDDELLTTLTITTGSDEADFWFEVPAAGTVKIKCLDAIAASGEDVFVEIAEILAYKPDVNDAYTVLRMATVNDPSGADGLGTDETDPVDISDDYSAHGMIYNPTHTEIRAQTTMNKNPIWETARRMINERQRMVERNNLEGYEVSGGKSILYYDRNPRGLSSLDLFDGIAPSTAAIASGDIRPGVKYKVTLGGGEDVTYDGTTYSTDGDEFTGVYGETDYTETGSPTVKESEIIIATAPEQGETNEWLMFMSTVAYEDRESSVFKPEAYGDILGFLHDRCTFLSKCWSQNVTKFNEIRQHVAYGAKPLLRTENPPGYRYLEHSDASCQWEATGNNLIQPDNGACDPTDVDCFGSINHYRSCQVYPPDYKVESVTLTASGQVKVTLTGRLQTDDAAPASISNTLASWTSAISTITTTGDGYRTDEMAVLEYLKYDSDGTHCTLRPGDISPDADTTSGYWAGDFNGSCFPRFYFTKLIPKVYEDGNFTLQDTDTRATVDNMLWMEYVLRAICEGYVDKQSTIDQLCEQCTGVFPDPCPTNRRLYDYTWETLNNQATGGRWLYFLPLEIRDDGQRGHGPLPNTLMYANHFNQIALAVNLLQRARFDLPTFFEKRDLVYEGTGSANLTNSDGESAADQFQDDVSAPPAATLTYTQAWQDDTSATAEQRVEFQLDGGGATELLTTRTDVEYRAGLSELRKNALPPDLKNLLTVSQSFGFLAAKQTGRQETDRQSATSATDEPPCSGAPFDDPASTWWKFVEVGTDDEHECLLITSGTLQADSVPVNDLYWYTDGSCTGVNFTKTVLVPQQGTGFVEVPIVP